MSVFTSGRYAHSRHSSHQQAPATADFVDHTVAKTTCCEEHFAMKPL